MKIYGDITNGYVKLYKEKPSVAVDHEIMEFDISDKLGEDRMYVGLSQAFSSEGVFGYGVLLSESLDTVREKREYTDEIAVKSLKAKTNDDVEYATKNYEFYLSVH